MEQLSGLLDGTQLALLSLFISIFGPIFIPPLIKFMDRKINSLRENTEVKKIESEAEKFEAEADGQEAKTAQIKVDTAKTLLEQQRILFDQEKEFFEKRILAIENSQKDTLVLLEEIKKKNTAIEQENQKIKNESYDLHQENKKLNRTISKLQSVITELKSLINKLLGGINKLIKSYKENNKDAEIPWEPVLTDKEREILQNDFLYDDDKLK